MTKLEKIQKWYFDHCNDEWEHQYGISIGTIDNPGWSIEINLIGTKLEDTIFNKIDIEKSDNDWIHCWVENNVFNGACGPLSLEKVLEIFLSWAAQNDKQ